MSTARFYERIKRNAKKGGEGYSLKLSEKLPLLMTGNYWLVAGLGGSGKTTLVDQLFILNMLDSDVKIRWIYNSMERPVHYKIAKWLSYLIWKHEGIYLGFHDVMQTRRAKLKLDDIDPLISKYLRLIDDKIFKHMSFSGKRKTAQQLTNGFSFEYKKYHQQYDIVLQITDHIGKIKPATGTNSYETMASYSDGIAEYRDNSPKAVIVDLMQVNSRKVNDAYRRKNFGAEILVSDAYGGDKPYQNCDVMIGIIHPWAMNIHDEYAGYDLTKLAFEDKDDCRYRGLRVMKGTYGGQTTVHSSLYGEVATFKELPKYLDINYDETMNLLK